MAFVFTKGPLVMTNEEAKVLACRKALEFAVDFGFLELIIEGNNANVMITIPQPQVNHSHLGHLYEDICYIASGLQCMSVSCVKRIANTVAHSLARYARNIADEIVWLEDSPPPALEALYFDSH